MDAVGEDGEHLRRKLELKWQPARIRATLGFAGLYQMTHEMIKRAVVVDVREFYWHGLEDGEVQYNERAYASEVLAKKPKDRFGASLLWLVEGGAVTHTQADRLNDVYAHRHSLSHELMTYIVDPDVEPDVDLLVDALSTLKAIRRFWTSVEKDIGTFDDFGDVDVDEVLDPSLAMLQMCIDAYVDGLPEDAS